MENLNPSAPQEASFTEVVDIQFRPGQKIYYFDPAGFTCHPGNPVIIDTARGPEYGICTAGNHTIPTKDVVAPLRPVLRHATARDRQTVLENQAKEKKAFAVCMEKVEEQQLDMQLVSAECAFDGSKILFFFTAEDRVDFRDLVKSLASVFHTRIELRQIGVRDKAKMVGGLGICGRPFCCASFLDDFQPVSIKMAKTQNLSLNPTKISGTCGRLMCCLKYEQDTYESLLQTSPKAESFVDTPDGRGTVVEVDLLRQRVRVKMEKQPEVIGTYANTDIAVLRNGKAKKNDPPIPEDLAPISGVAKRAAAEEKSEVPMFATIRFRSEKEEALLSPEVPAESEKALPEQPAESTDRKHRRNRKPRHKGGEKAAPKAAEPSKPEAAPKQESAPKQTAEGAAKKRHRPNYRRRKKPSGNPEA